MPASALPMVKTLRCSCGSFANIANVVAGKLPLNLWMQECPEPKTHGQNQTGCWPKLTVANSTPLWSGSSTCFARSVSHLLRALEDVPLAGYRICFPFRAGGYLDADGEDGFYGSRGRGGARAQSHHRSVRAGLRNAKAKGRRLGRPRKIQDAGTITRLRRQGRSWRAIGVELAISATTAYCEARKGRLEIPPR